MVMPRVVYVSSDNHDSNNRLTVFSSRLGRLVSNYFYSATCLEPGGFQAISRGLSAAIPPAKTRHNTSAPRQGCQMHAATTPAGVVAGWFLTDPGGIASLNPRLMAVIPPG